MDLVNVGHLHQSQNDSESEARAIRGVMIQKRESLQCIEREIAQLIENKKTVEQDLVRLGIALGPHNRSLLPNEILSRIFVLLALDYGTVGFPFFKNDLPPQLIVSHVCSNWRWVAFRTPELWGDTKLSYTTNDAPHFIRLLQRWLFRARTFPVTLSIDFDKSLDGDGLAIALQNILLPIRVKKLSLCLTHKIFVALSTLPEAMLSGLSEFGLHLTLQGRQENMNMSNPHPLIIRLQSLTFDRPSRGWIDPPHPSLPWGQLRSLEIRRYQDLDLIMGILRQIPKLEALSLRVDLLHDYDTDALEQLTMPSLQTFILSALVVPGKEVDKILRCFICPILIKFKFRYYPYGNWTFETFGILKQRYNMQGLREATFVGNLPLPVSSFLRDAPMLRLLSLGRNAIMDDDAVIGLSNGSLGRFLRKVVINFACDIREVLGMLETRRKMVNALMKNGCTWREEITILKDVVIHTKQGKGYEDRVGALQDAGISIKFA